MPVLNPANGKETVLSIVRYKVLKPFQAAAHPQDKTFCLLFLDTRMFAVVHVRSREICVRIGRHTSTKPREFWILESSDARAAL